MKIVYDAEVDVLRVLLCDAAIESSDEEKPGVIIDYDYAGNVVGFEFLDASKRTPDPSAVELSVVGRVA